MRKLQNIIALLHLSITYFIWCMTTYMMRWTRVRVPCKVTRCTKLQGAQRAPELALRSTDCHAPKNLIFPALSIKSIASILALYANTTSHKISNKFHALTFDNTWMTSVWGQFWPLLAQKPSNNNFPKKIAETLLSPFCSVLAQKPKKPRYFPKKLFRSNVTSCKKFDKNNVSVFHKNWKT